MPFQMCRFHDPRMCRKLRRLVSGGSFDVVHSTYAQLGPYLSMAKRTDPTVATVLTDIDLVFVTMEREESTRKGAAKLLFASDRKRVSSYVAREWTSFSKIIAMSDVDRQKLLAVQPDLDVAVVPNGVDTAYFAPVGERRADSVKLMFLGGSQHSPNVDAVRYFCDEIYGTVRRVAPEVYLEVVGAFDDRLIHDDTGSVKYTGYVDDVRPFLLDSAMLIVPLRVGGGTRLKILEAMAMGVPVVSTSVGCEGIDAEPQRDIVVADEPDEFARAILNVLNTPALRESLAKNGRDVVERKYGWRQIARRLSEVYVETAGTGH